MNQANYPICTRVLTLNKVYIFLCEMNTKFWVENMAGLVLMQISTSRQNRMSPLSSEWAMKPEGNGVKFLLASILFSFHRWKQGYLRLQQDKNLDFC